MDESVIRLDQNVIEALVKPFSRDMLSIKPGSVREDGSAALVLPYIDARAVMDRLDDVVPGQWAFDWEPTVQYGEALAVKGKLTVCGITRCDVGQAHNEDEPYKSAVSDALKRCAVQFGIGRGLYELPKIWAPGKREGKFFRFDNEWKLIGLVAELGEAMQAGDYGRVKALKDQIREGNYEQASSRQSSSATPAGRPSGDSARNPNARRVSARNAQQIVERCRQRWGNDKEAIVRFFEETIGRVCEPIELTVDEYAALTNALNKLSAAAA